MFARFAHFWLPESADLSDEVADEVEHTRLTSVFCQEALGLENGFRVRLREDGLLAAFVLLLVVLGFLSIVIALCCRSTDQKRTKRD